ncbi:MAG: hypothetical protein MZV63_33575 [Marinilabiliales bacterium]|nr:hypothetical protein [Marinilabiliales bacterium]
MAPFQRHHDANDFGEHQREHRGDPSQPRDGRRRGEEADLYVVWSGT